MKKIRKLATRKSAGVYVADDGTIFEATGKTECGREVYAKQSQWETAVRSIDDNLLFVLLEDGRVVSMREFERRSLRQKEATK